MWQAARASQERDDSNLHLGLGGMVHSQIHGGGSGLEMSMRTFAVVVHHGTT